MRSRLAGLLLFFGATLPLNAAYTISVWIPTWDPNALSSVQQHASAMTESNPGWYTLSADGSIGRNSGAENGTMRAAVTGTLLIPTIKNNAGGSFNGALVADVLRTTAGRESHAEALARLVSDKGFDGIDIDYELVPASSRDAITGFIQLLASKLHATSKKLSVTVSAKTGVSQDWDGPGGQDWPALGAAADSIKIMAYDKHYPGGTPGDISPLAWLDQVAAYADTAIPAGKVVFGLPWYGYDWAGSNATGLTYEQAKNLALRVGATVNHDDDGEATFTYPGHIVYFQDASSYEKKVSYLASRHSRIRGFAHWRAGAEDPAIWDIVSNLKNGGVTTVPSTPSPVDFSINGPMTLQLRVGATQSAIFSVVGINGFNSDATVTATMIDTFSGSVTTSGTVRPGTPTTLTVTAATDAVPGTYRVRVRITSGTIAHENVLSVTIAQQRHRAVTR
jgi:spore germination protein YaaH